MTIFQTTQSRVPATYIFDRLFVYLLIFFFYISFVNALVSFTAVIGLLHNAGVKAWCDNPKQSSHKDMCDNLAAKETRNHIINYINNFKSLCNHL